MNVPNDITTYNKVYYVMDEAFPDNNPSLAIVPKISGDGHQMQWRTTGRKIELNCEQVIFPNEDTANPAPAREIKVTLENGRILVLRELTCEVYNTKMKSLAKTYPFKGDDTKLQQFYKDFETFKLMNGY